MTQYELELKVETALTEGDVSLLDELNCSDDVMKIMAAEHASRSVTLAKAIEPTMGRAFLLVVAGAFLQAAKDLDANSYHEGELVDVG